MANKSNHLERTATEPRSTELHSVRLRRVDQVNEKIRLFRLELDKGPIQFLPGQWLDTYVPGIAKAGGFTITCPPSAAASSVTGDRVPYLELAVQESPENAIAAWLWQPIEKIMGSQLHVRVGGSFVFPPLNHARLNTIERVVFVAGGVGINPLMSMLSYIAEVNDFANLHVLIFYASKMPRQGGLDQILFVRRIAALFSEGRINGEFKLYLSGDSKDLQRLDLSRRVHNVLGTNIDVRVGRLSGLDLSRSLKDKQQCSNICYICGPPSMTDDLSQSLISDRSELGTMPTQVITEKWW